MVRTTSILLAIVLSCPIGHVLAAPVNNTVDANTFLQNGETAQQLNSEFHNLTINDPCQSGTAACISGAQAQCNSNGTWEVQQCQEGTQCFALPNKKSAGTNIKCKTEQDALSLIQETGAQGGICGNNSTNSGNGTISNVPVDSGSDNNSAATATVTILVAPSTTQTLGPDTATLDGAGFSSLLASLQSGGVSATTTGSDSQTTGTTTSSGVAGAVVTGSGSDAQGAAAAAATTILLTTGSSTPTASSGPSGTPNAAVASAAPSSPPSGGGYKY